MATRRFLPVIVTWIDTSNYKGWREYEDIPRAIIRNHTIGWLVEEDNERVTVATVVNQFQLSDVTVIPIGCILDVRRLCDDCVEISQEVDEYRVSVKWTETEGYTRTTDQVRESLDAKLEQCQPDS